MHFFDGTVLYGFLYKEGRSYYIRLRLDEAIGINQNEILPVKIPNLTEFLHGLRKIYVPNIY
jgi:hypothetical protein